MRLKPDEQTQAAWKAGTPWNATISRVGRCIDCKHRTILALDGTAVLFHDAACPNISCRHDDPRKCADHHMASDRHRCQHCKAVFLEECRHPKFQVDKTFHGMFQLGQCIKYKDGRGEVWGHIAEIRWNSSKREVWIHPFECPNLVLTVGDIIDWRPTHENHPAA